MTTITTASRYNEAAGEFKLLTVPQAAQRFGVDVDVLTAGIEAETLASATLTFADGSETVFLRSDQVERWISRNKVDRAPSTAGPGLRVLRAALGFSQREFAHEIGVSRSYLSHVEAGHCHPSEEWLGWVVSRASALISARRG